jgi:hypothetical protein
MQHLDEATIHAWLDGELPLEERAEVEAHVASCDECKAAVAEARGFIAASTRILTALDSVPGGVIPTASKQPSIASRGAHRRFVVSRAWMAAAAVLVLSSVTVIAIRPGSDATQLRVASAVREEKKQDASAAPAEAAPQAVMPSASNAPAPMQAQKTAPAADESKPAEQNERLKSKLDAARQSNTARAGAAAASGEPGGSAPSAMRSAAPPAPAPAPEPSAAAGGVAAMPATPPVASALAKDAAEKRADVVSRYESQGERRAATSDQSVSISGHVTSDAGAPIASASVMLQGMNIGTITHDDGSYSFTVPASRAKAEPAVLVAKVIGYKAATDSIAALGGAITHDFTLHSNPLALGQVIVTGAGTTSATENLGSVTAPDSASADSAPRILSRKKRYADGDTVVTTIYSVRGVSVSLIDHSLSRDDAQVPKLRDAVNEMSAKSRAAAAAVNSISWSDSTGHTRTLRGPLSLDDLQSLKRALFGTTP